MKPLMKWVSLLGKTPRAIDFMDEIEVYTHQNERSCIQDTPFDV